MAISMSAILSVPVILLITYVEAYYGLILFVGVPFASAVTAPILYGYHQQRDLSESLSVACCAVFMIGGFLLIFAIEGVVCLILASPFAFATVVIGGLFGHAIHRLSGLSSANHAALLLVLFVSLPVLIGFERINDADPSILHVSSSITIDARPAEVWRQMIASADLNPPEHWVFDAGIGYPISSRIHGRGKGAKRHCTFSTGSFKEEITDWNPPHHLAFAVEEHAPAMNELSPYGKIQTPHLGEFAVPKGGAFRLEELPGDRTRLTRSTTYRLSVRPVVYWRLWSDWIIHRVHMRVLRHMKNKVEKESIK